MAKGDLFMAGMIGGNWEGDKPTKVIKMTPPGQKGFKRTVCALGGVHANT